jgi:ABC-2 type transport system permease protein
MNKTLTILKTEFINTVSRRSFLLTLILVPLLPALILGGISLFGNNEAESSPGIGDLLQPPAQSPLPEGYVDQAGIITQLPEWTSPESLIAFDTEDQAKEALLAGEISGYNVIPADILETGSIRFVNEDFNPLNSMDNTSGIDNVIRYNLLGADEAKFYVYSDPVIVETVDLAPETVERDMDNPFAFYLPYGVTMLLYVLIITSASLMMTSVAKEKENRVMEILISSVKPRQLLTGKILGLGLVGLLQTVVWLGSGFLMLRLGGTTLNIPANLQLPPELLIWSIVFFLLGYLLYATIMAGVGALVPNIKEATQATFIIILPLLVPLMLISMLIETPNATLPLILSLFPFSAPVTILTRMAVTPVPLWQILTAIVLLIGTILVLIRAVAGMFRAQILLTGQKFSLGTYLRTLFGKKSEAA